MTQFKILTDSINELFSVRENEEIILTFNFREYVKPRFKIDHGGDYFLLDYIEVCLTNELGKNTIVPYAYHDGEMIVLDTDINMDDIYEVVHTMFGLDVYDLEVETLPDDVIEMKNKLRLLLGGI